MKSGLAPGATAELIWPVTHDRVIGLDAGRLAVFSTPSMINLMEHAARQVLHPYLEQGEESVGVDVNIAHTAATPLGAAVRGVATVTQIDQRIVQFNIRAYDAIEEIGSGTHRRAVIRTERLGQRIAQKEGQLPHVGSTSSVTSQRALVAEPQLEPNAGDLPPLSEILLSVSGNIARITLNRPASLNAMTPKMAEELYAILCWLAGHPAEARVAIVTGSSRTFCAGDDLKQLRAMSSAEAEAWNVAQARLFMAFERIPQPIIAAINGACFGAGVVIACACDFRIASRTAKFGMPELNLGWPPAFAIPQLAVLVGKSKAIDLCLRGKTISATEAQSIGLISDLHSPVSLDRAVTDLAKDILRQPPIALARTRQLLHRILPGSTPFSETLTNAVYMNCLETADAREGLAAFIEKRPAKFKGA